MKKHIRKIIFGGMGGFLALGMINAFIINTHSGLMGSVTYVKGLDEMYGITQPGRVLATNSNWKKIETFETNENIEDVSHEAIVQNEPPSAIPEDVKLDLVEVMNPRIWNKGIQKESFSGDLETSHGRIESLSVSLPGREEISISFAEMNGNVFQYDYAGEIYTGMLYQVDPKSYMVTLTNGPLEGTRLRFVEGFAEEQVAIKETLKEENNIDVGFFGENEKRAEQKKSKAADPSLVEAQMINMNEQV